MNKNNLCIASFALLLMVGQISAQDHLWLFNEGYGRIAYDEKGGWKGKDKVNGYLSNADWREESVHITGADDSYVTFGTAIGQFGRDDFTVAFWIRTRDTLGLYDLVGNRADPGHGNWFAVRMTGDGYVSAEVDEDAQGTNYVGFRSAKGRLNDGQWHHITVTRKGGDLALYIDGKFSNSGSARRPANIRNNRPFRIGRSLVDRGTRRFAPDATFDDLAIYSQALSAKEINYLYGN